ncbi:alanyl-tRNA editing protein AlaX [Candidatus Woesearchaeota archaeon]|nr:alanyl-tRNA editing protein AlaX [Candidatus Woesearchaeota archaeon]|tara:strand:- start:418 stop:1119 length:702 start_codon:yes stop_codon:yes gene_type:complete
MTKALYLDDAYLKEFNANITKVEGTSVWMDETAFYPTSGGQPNDTGTIKADKEYKVVNVIKQDGDIVHIVDQEGLQPGPAECTIDWERRYKLMRMHTSAHVLSQTIFKATDALCSGNELGEEKSRMDFSVPITKDQFQGFVEEANKIIDQDLPITWKFMPKEEAMKLGEAFRLMGKNHPNLDVLRMVSIGDFDIQADGGTHVKSTKLVGHLGLIKFENKGAQRKRIYWELTQP